ncbi:MAG TPA: FAD-binding protein [Gemmatimonadaceae bacterium]|nr:FAD-binding protein [Gemmatimonadaceae bacterium]
MTFLAELENAAAPVRDVVRSALENGTSLRLVGARTWLAAGRPVLVAEELSAGAGGIVEYVPGDLTITVRAGTPMRDIAHVTAAHNQWLPLDPFGAADITIGATVATCSAGPLAHAFGTPRDQVIGLGFVTGRGDYVRGGGRVVKNVAGFDLTRLVIGSWGTLGVVTDVTLRLRSRPETDVTIALVLSDESVKFRDTLGAISEMHVAPFAMELVNAVAARAIGTDGDTLLLLRLGGNPATVAAQRETFRRLGEIRDMEPAVWDSLRRAEPPNSASARFSGPLTGFGGLWQRLQRELGTSGAFIHGTPGRGIVRCSVPDNSAALLPRLAAVDGAMTTIFEQLPGSVWTTIDSMFVSGGLSSRVRDAFDPAMLLNPGILGQPLS